MTRSRLVWGLGRQDSAGQGDSMCYPVHYGLQCLAHMPVTCTPARHLICIDLSLPSFPGIAAYSHQEGWDDKDLLAECLLNLRSPPPTGSVCVSELKSNPIISSSESSGWPTCGPAPPAGRDDRVVGPGSSGRVRAGPAVRVTSHLTAHSRKAHRSRRPGAHRRAGRPCAGRPWRGMGY